MSGKRPAIDLMALTSDQAMPMPEAVQRVATAATVHAPRSKVDQVARRVPSAELQPLAFKVPPEFRKRFRQRAADADLKLNELLFLAFTAWEEKEASRKKS